MNALSPSLAAASAGSTARSVAIVVLGMHRSGTSVLTRMLGLLGCGLPRTLMPGTDANPRGYWESNRVCVFNDEVLEKAGSSWSDWLPVNPTLPKSPVWHGLVEQGRAIVREEFGDESLIVLKDPRICRLSKLWLDVLKAERIDCVFAMPVRNPIDVARSLHHRDGLDEHYGLLLWLRHVLEAEAATRGEKRSFVAFEQLLTDWELVAGRVSIDLDLAWPRLSPLSARQISEFVSPSLQNHASSRMALRANPSISDWVTDAFDVFTRWSQDGEQPADHGALDAIRSAFDAAAPAFARPMLSTVDRDLREREFQATRDEAQAALERSQGEVCHLQTLQDAQALELRRLQDESETRASEYEASIRSRDEAVAQLLARETLLATLQVERDTALAELATAEAQRNELSATLAQSEASRLAQSENLAHAKAEIAALQEDVTLRSAEATERLGQAQALSDCLQETEARLHETLDENAGLRVAADQAQAQGAHASRQTEQLELRIQELTGETFALMAAADHARGRTGAVQQRLDQQITENDLLTRQVRERNSAIMQAESRIRWLRQVYAVMVGSSALLQMVPAGWLSERRARRLKTRQLFDSEAYLTAYPDVAAEGVNPLQHYIMYGIEEGRQVFGSDRFGT